MFKWIVKIWAKKEPEPEPEFEVPFLREEITEEVVSVAQARLVRRIEREMEVLRNHDATEEQKAVALAIVKEKQAILHKSGMRVPTTVRECQMILKGGAAEAT